jgi:hypothetical protein
LIVAYAANGQNDVKNVIKVNPLGLLFGTTSLSYERVLTPKSALQINANYGNIKILGISISNVGVGADYRLYFSKSKEAPRGFYFAPGAAYSNVSVENVSGSAFSLSGVAGYQWVWKSGFELDLYLGPQYTFGGELNSGGTNYAQFSGFGPKLGVSIGYGF